MSNLTRRSFLEMTVMAGAALAIPGPNRAFAAEFRANELCYMSAQELIPLFRSTKLSPVEVLKAQIARYEGVGEKTNSVTYTHFEEAMKQAQESETRYANGTARRLEGITVGVKDEHHDKGWIVTRGSKLLKDNKMDFVDPIVAKLKQDGAVLPLQTTVPEFYMSGVTWSKLWGVSRCPWNTNYSVGGSSGGSGGALAAGLCTLATGSDMGGSIRLPSAYNGLYGCKPSHGRVASSATLAYFSTTGPLARSFNDMVSLMNNMSGQTPHLPATLQRLDLPHYYPSIKGFRIAYVGSMGLAHLDSDTKHGMTAAIADLRSAGATVDDVDVKLGFDWQKMVEVFIGGVLAGSMGPGLSDVADQTDKMTSYAGYFAKKAASGAFGPKQAAEFEAFINSFYATISDAVFEQGYDAIVMPTLATPHVPADYDQTVEGFTVDGKGMHKTFILALAVPWNVLNWCPVVNVPTRLSSQGMPMGMQIIGKPYHDKKVFQIAHAYERVAPKLFVADRMPDFSS